MINPLLFSNKAVGNTYPSDNVPFELMSKLIREELPNRPVIAGPADGGILYAGANGAGQGLSKKTSGGGLDEMVDHIVKHRAKHGRPVFSHAHVKEHMLRHTDGMGLSRAAGAGFWDDLWSGIKNTASDVWSGIKNVGSNLVSNIAADPLGAIAKVAPLLV